MEDLILYVKWVSGLWLVLAFLAWGLIHSATKIKPPKNKFK